MANVKGRGVRVEIARTYGTPIAITALTNASPPVATANAHGLLANAVGYLNNVLGMVQIDKQAVRVKAPTVNNFELQGLNTTNFGTWTSGFFVPVTAWSTLAESTSYDIGGGAAEKLDVTTLLDVIKKEEQGLLPVQTASFGVIAQDVPTEAGALLRAAVQAQGTVVVRITLGGALPALRLFTGEPSVPGESVQQGAVGTGTLDMSVKGEVLFLPN